MQRRLSLLDRIVIGLDRTRRHATGEAPPPARHSPALLHDEAALDTDERRHVAGLMRVNHTGEVCAQALYHGQALTAKLPAVRREMERAALEEQDHLAWCEDRLRELDSHLSILNPLWYGLSFGIGAAAGIAGDRWSLGFVAETEKQVCAHLDSHLQRVPENDARTRAILTQMHTDEADHRQMALRAGGAELPPPIRRIMGLVSKVMTRTSYLV